ncbi:DNA-processing protein DprA [Corynebacterium sp. P3-F1]|uniref:DNA-processing protein DprA n=1 Tax=Corynebacterium sp. P3-F1 TaxID=3059080 RepID=UPI00265D2741|nr:DNA-processing protein DprA [Corynebacterium sp. P3-F1]WKK61774.1 DNA-processing protein DprA [Corynebacterium sp. P3-F1]
MSSLESWAYLNRVVEGPNRHIQAMLAAGRDADELAHGIRHRASWLAELGPATETRYTWDQPAEDLAAAEEYGYALLTPESTEWPREMMGESFGAALAGASKSGAKLPPDAYPPHALWVRGSTDIAQLTASAVGIVGTRAASSYGHHATADLSKGLVRHQHTIVSGGALGIDTVAHTTALDAGGATMVVAACGAGQSYPRRNEALFTRIATEGGAVITEYPPGVTPDRHRFLTRNRLVAALTQGTIVVEAAFRSGALNTLKWAEVFNRRAMAVPGPILGPGSLGTNLAIRDGRAMMVLSADDAHEQLSPVGTSDVDGQYEIDFASDAVQQLSRNELRVYDALPLTDTGGMEASDIAQACGFTVGLTVHLLMDLSTTGLVAREGQFWRRV